MENNINLNSNLTGRKVLVVEHNDLNFYSIERILSHSGLKLLRSYSGKETIRICAKCVDIVIISSDVPNIDTLSLVKEIKVIQPELPVVTVASAYSDDEKNKYMDAGCEAYIFKPLQKEFLLSEIARCLMKNSEISEYINCLAIN